MGTSPGFSSEVHRQISRCESRAWGTLYAARELAGKEDPICSGQRGLRSIKQVNWFRCSSSYLICLGQKSSKGGGRFVPHPS